VEPGYAAIHLAVMGYFADRANVPPASLSSDAITAWIETRRLDASLAAEVRHIIGACNMARYAAGTARGEDGRALLAKARETLATVEREIA
jgi:hypothetical protein